MSPRETIATQRRKRGYYQQLSWNLKIQILAEG